MTPERAYAGLVSLMPPALANYRQMLLLAERCGVCDNFCCDDPAGPNRCNEVAGTIQADMVCDEFEPYVNPAEADEPPRYGIRPAAVLPSSQSIIAPMDMPTISPSDAVLEGRMMEYAVVKSEGEKRYTFGPLYLPDTLDAHSEFVTSEDLQAATWDYVRKAVESGSNTIYRQHTTTPAGEWVEIVSWPTEYTVKMEVPGVGEVERTFPPGTVFQGVVWSEDAWPDVKDGKILGLSMGGMAKREPVTAVHPAS